MREITTHKVNGCNEDIVVLAHDEPGSGGACHCYGINIVDRETRKAPASAKIQFQNGPIDEVGTNGVTHEALLAIVADRLECFQAGPYACTENANALGHVRKAMEWLHTRTRERISRGVEGTHAK